MKGVIEAFILVVIRLCIMRRWSIVRLIYIDRERMQIIWGGVCVATKFSLRVKIYTEGKYFGWITDSQDLTHVSEMKHFKHHVRGLFLCTLLYIQVWQNHSLWNYSHSCGLYCYMINFFNLISLEQWYFSLIWNTYMWKLQTFYG